MALKGQLLELRNEGNYQFLLRVGVYDESAAPSDPKLPDDCQDEEGLPFDQPIEVFECRLDFSDPEKAVSYPQGALIESMRLLENNKDPGGLDPFRTRLWMIAYIVDSIIAEIFATDVLEVIYGDEYQHSCDQCGECGRIDAAQTDDTKSYSPPIPQCPAVKKPPAGKRCPDCGAQARGLNFSSDQVFVCDSCGRHFKLKSHA
ncbi:MAG: hypothetical protein A2268_01095 [Candidatus Raymondbacteria bacterium RifOxyA12_full_50_37]|uniref:Uncharacterized protein n=1 Tax=Candidatus Raymondbacteria bacterium RIFOXYD12_FULL_49_13 TaxID=1817890 RepID=A0A1F7FFP7_UNCRA|nr:MAG: hypothetical protein A2268_01095 [Candidatus Raymondbacteria bacterium RifOxyA12_full_50_37]OGJ86399.1 MAG: hypothetical protein A2248_14060 [Candidatus Raymondbacteria bacterium RIFOXYA2_FULL_49_16]OGJ95522.1 MAG: hypothetical protein A2350_11040 [Candidatus Raymondbacteria bacterium RifOxyB12_full_50_8]OGJ95569.1 MAG: hypothetical protein A2453_12835 [Candidatus Raymondbacteria bacterium RIFOXYC2_FULL_50_21]OGJ97208.1 MAG: hypothetical protein A2487_09860 [Candidatus Raymondbacteria b